MTDPQREKNRARLRELIIGLSQLYLQQYDGSWLDLIPTRERNNYARVGPTVSMTLVGDGLEIPE